MKIIEYIRDYFAPAYSNKYANPIEDAKLLSAIGSEGEFICARNGKSYFYYAPYDARNMDVAQYLLRRNARHGISADIIVPQKQFYVHHVGKLKSDQKPRILLKVFMYIKSPGPIMISGQC